MALKDISVPLRRASTPTPQPGWERPKGGGASGGASPLTSWHSHLSARCVVRDHHHHQRVSRDHHRGGKKQSSRALFGWRCFLFLHRVSVPQTSASLFEKLRTWLRLEEVRPRRKWCCGINARLFKEMLMKKAFRQLLRDCWLLQFRTSQGRFKQAWHDVILHCSK